MKSGGAVYEPFRLPCCAEGAPAQKMHISMHELRVEERNEKEGLHCAVTYFTVPNGDLPALFIQT